MKIRFHVIINLLKMLLLSSLCIVVFACKLGKVTVEVESSRIDIYYNKKIRITGGEIIIGEKKETLRNDIAFRDIYSNNVLGLFIDIEKNKELKTDQFVGMFFENMPDFKQGVQIWRYKPWNSWTKPIKVNNPSELEDWDVQFFYWQYTDGTFGAAIPLSGNGYRTTLGSHNKKFGAKASLYVDKTITGEVPLMAVAFGEEPYELFEQLYAAGLKMMGKEENLRSKKIYPEIFEYFGWCSWNSSGNGGKLNDKLLYEAATSFTSNGFKLPWMIIDDGWSQNTGSQLNSYEPIVEKFPNGFKPLIDTLKQKFGVKYVGVWHAFNCYWAGINKESKLGKKYEKSLYKWIDKNPMDPNDPGKERYMINPYSDSMKFFYNEWHKLMKAQGVDFVKVDNQLVVERMAKNNFPIWDVTDQMHKALYSSVENNFGGAIINCMDMTNDAFYNFGKSAIARTVEDYFPYEENETYNMQKGNAAAHVTQALYNSLYFQQMVWPDFDMFESYNPNAGFHAIARAISGGPIYVTDFPGKQNFDVLRPLVYSDGRIIRADVPCRLTYDCLFQVQDAAPLKAYSYANGAGLLAIWNAVDTNLVSESFKVSDIPNLKGNKFLLFEHFSREVKVVGLNDLQQISLGRMEYKYYNIIPIQKEIAVIGLIYKYNAPKTVEKIKIGKGFVSFILHEGGECGVYLPVKPSKIIVNNQEVKSFNFNNQLLSFSTPGKLNEEKRVEIIY